jgi:two-component system, OmpR family, heavy metal sensor histidine kinase CusS
MKPWRYWTLAARVSALFSLIACLVVTGLGLYLYHSAQQALELRADYTLIGRVEHFRKLMHDLVNVEQMELHPVLFESMMGNEQDVRIFRRQGEAPFINMNPDQLQPPLMTPRAIGAPLSIADLHDGQRADGVRVRWIAALAEVGEHKDTVEIVAAYVMTQESHMMRTYLWRVVAAVALTVLLTGALGFVVLRRDLMPLTRMSKRAAEITPTNLSTRLREEEAPAELRQLAGALNAMLDRLENGYEHLSQFSADLAHEIRTPVNILMGQTQVTLGQRRGVEEYEQLLESNLEELTRLSRIIDNILFLAQADHAGLKVERSAIDLREELQRIADYFEGVAAERDMHFQVQVADTAVCQANLVMFRRAVSNLVVNAVRYGDADSTIVIEAALAEENHANRHVVITVENRGTPMNRQQMERMFDRFYRGDKSRSEYTESNGLGLAIVKAIMTLHGGSADVSCDASGCIRFSLRFPT